MSKRIRWYGGLVAALSVLIAVGVIGERIRVGDLPVSPFGAPPEAEAFRVYVHGRTSYYGLLGLGSGDQEATFLATKASDAGRQVMLACDRGLPYARIDHLDHQNFFKWRADYHFQVKNSGGRGALVHPVELWMPSGLVGSEDILRITGGGNDAWKAALDQISSATLGGSPMSANGRVTILEVDEHLTVQELVSVLDELHRHAMERVGILMHLERGLPESMRDALPNQ